jgi:type I restriction enzyme S subunit
MMVKKLTELCNIQYGYAFDSANFTEDDSFLPLVRIRDVKRGYSETFYSGTYPEEYVIHQQDLLVGMDGEFNIARWKGGDALLNQRVCKITAKPNVNEEYLRFYLSVALKKIEDKTSFVTVKHLSTKELNKLELKPPDICQQKQIADTLGRIEILITLRQQQLQKLDELVKARFVEMFGDFKLNTMKWPVVKFDDIAVIDGNMTTDYDKYADYPHIGIDSIEKDTGNLKGYRTVAEDGVISGKYVFTSEHIIYSKIRPNLNKVALPDFEGLCSADAYPILPIKGQCNRVFLAYDMRSQFFLDYILQFCNRTNLPKVNRKEVSGFKTPLPPLDLQNQFADFVKAADKSKAVVRKALA